ncbi:hypothetical protein AOXY_G6245 [Acipenser oxyrinchus oxyrinchus]|uniref:Uncharacterized protein n=1 Tax=Acipenser oxyrinchus oxyrinchus TaxID=40147 RepID=A0AAD8GC18_ACIOX|nr:hypothetical protein AOXY_G6245 [Acipenser oxyrinchus oxyrinchus]
MKELNKIENSLKIPDELRTDETSLGRGFRDKHVKQFTDSDSETEDEGFQCKIAKLEAKRNAMNTKSNNAKKIVQKYKEDKINTQRSATQCDECTKKDEDILRLKTEKKIRWVLK